MTWAELHGVLRDGRLVPPEDATLPDAGDRVVTGIAYDSRAVAPGQVFVALKGQHADGTAFARQATDRGAVVIVSEQQPPDETQVPWTIVKDARLALAQLAAAFYRNPSREMRVIGITGTNGKTTTAYLVGSIFDAAGIR
jgi:UDP-N-acetylmuramoyl-L-alanyl-D-glutamate--2,6-diaminopimelate ligase